MIIPKRGAPSYTDILYGRLVYHRNTVDFAVSVFVKFSRIIDLSAYVGRQVSGGDCIIDRVRPILTKLRNSQILISRFVSVGVKIVFFRIIPSRSRQGDRSPVVKQKQRPHLQFSVGYRAEIIPHRISGAVVCVVYDLSDSRALIHIVCEFFLTAEFRKYHKVREIVLRIVLVGERINYRGKSLDPPDVVSDLRKAARCARI